MADELQLPRIEPKGNATIAQNKYRYNSVRKTGPESLRHFKRTYVQALRRQIATGQYSVRRPHVIPVKDDKRYRSWSQVSEPQKCARAASQGARPAPCLQATAPAPGSLAAGPVQHLRDRLTGRECLVFNVHLRFNSADSRVYSARFIMKVIEGYGDHLPVILGGDMNTFPACLDLRQVRRLPAAQGSGRPAFSRKQRARSLRGGPRVWKLSGSP